MYSFKGPKTVSSPWLGGQWASSSSISASKRDSVQFDHNLTRHMSQWNLVLLFLSSACCQQWSAYMLVYSTRHTSSVGYSRSTPTHNQTMRTTTLSLHHKESPRYPVATCGHSLGLQYRYLHSPPSYPSLLRTVHTVY